MIAEIGLPSMTQIQKLSQSQHQNQSQLPNPNSTPFTTTSSLLPSWMWNPREHQDEDDSWEVRAFAEDTRNIMGTTWPPRSYTCTFCRREFRSAQALGGHMNVHRRDRARLHHQAHPASATPNHNPASGGLCVLYHLPSPNNNFPLSSSHNTLNNTSVNACGTSSTLLSLSSYSPCNNLVVMPTASSTSFDFPLSKVVGPTPTLTPTTTSSAATHTLHEDLDLELRLGHKSTPN